MEQIRSFIAIELPENVKTLLNRLEEELKSSCPRILKWVIPGNIHLTLKFLGNIDPSKINLIQKAIIESEQGIAPFNLSINQIGVFPNLKNIQVVWVGLSGDVEILLKMQNKIESALVPLGFPVENRPFTAHLTLARVSEFASFPEKQSLSKVISEYRPRIDVSFPVNTVSLMKSQLTRSGAIYSRLSLTELKSS